LGRRWADLHPHALEDVTKPMILVLIMMMFASTFFPLI